MKLKSVTIDNFKGLEHIEIEFNEKANVIVGPNAIGKTTVLEAIRLAKAILAPRTDNEAQQTLIGLGAVSPHLPQQLNLAAISANPAQPTNIQCRYVLSDAEVQRIEALKPQVVNALIGARLGPSNGGPVALTQFLSSPIGQQALVAEQLRFDQELPGLKNSKTCVLDLSIGPAGLRGGNQFSQIVLAVLESSLPPHVSLFTYFPADRALPTGEVGIQIGGPDVAAQLASHNAQPQTKYARLKTTIVNSYLMSGATKEMIFRQFTMIFSKLLKDREIVGLEINQFGLVSIKIKELVGGRMFDIDGMSSGEKGLILTFLLIARTVAEGGIILLDEPELHLNPAVCKLLLPFLIENYLDAQNLQAIICSHSPEILGAAFDQEGCSLFHLQKPNVMSQILPDDKREVFDALKRLGTNASDVLFTNGTIFVEGDDDADLLSVGFSAQLSRYQVVELGGRSNVEKEIITLQEAEVRGEVDTLKCFIFDLDKARNLRASTKLIKVLQWKRRCLENYLIDEKIIYELLRTGELSEGRIENRGEVQAIFRELALEQLRDEVALETYNSFGFENLGARPRELRGKSYAEKAGILFARIDALRGQLPPTNRDVWCDEFVAKCKAEYQRQVPEWQADWLSLCDGKQFFKQLYSKFGIKIAPIALKKRIMSKMEGEKADSWVLVDRLISDALKIE